jgi:hypothetical protein
MASRDRKKAPSVGDLMPQPKKRVKATRLHGLAAFGFPRF